MKLETKFKNKKVLITGAEGFIGRHLIDALLGYRTEIHGIYFKKLNKNISGKVFWYKVDIRNKEKLRQLVQKIKPDFIFHLAALLVKGDKPKEINQIIETNLVGTSNLLQALEGIKFSKLIFLGSGDEYGQNKAPFRETQTPLPQSAYAFSKTAAVNLCLTYSRTLNYPIVALRPSVVYGPGQKSKMFIPSLLNTLLKNKPLEISGGEQTRDFLYVDDLIKAILVAAMSNVKGEIINIGNGKSYQLKVIIEKAKKLIGSKSKITFTPYRQKEIMNYSFNISKAKKLLNWQPHYTLDSGIEKTIEIKAKDNT